MTYHHKDTQNSVVAPRKGESKSITFKTVGDAFLESLGAKGIGQAPSGTRLISDIGMRYALERAVIMGIKPEVAKGYLEDALPSISLAISQCESPIERRLLPALVFANYGPKFLTFPARIHLPKKEELPPLGDLIIIPQFAFIKYRIDFAIVCSANDGSRAIFGVECDGMEFHSYNRNGGIRDHYLKGFGVEIFHLTGSDIYSDPHQAAQVIAQVISDWREVRG